MLRRIFIILLVVATTLTTARAQTADIATQHYKEFVRLNEVNGSKDSMYSSLRGCYTNCVANLKYNQSEQAKSLMQDIYLHLQSGAIYFSQKGDSKSALFFSQAYVDATLMPEMAGVHLDKNEYYPTIVYFAASGTYNAREYERAVVYFREFLKTGEDKNRQVVFTYMAKSCMNTGKTEMAKVVLEEAIKSYPTDFNLLSMAINSCIDTDDNTNLQDYLTRALTIRPQDETLLNIQGKLYEDNYDFQNALSVYTSLRNANPQSLEVAKHLALNYYNLGVTYSNRGITEDDKIIAEQTISQANDYFTQAVVAIKEILTVDPMSLKYCESLAVCYSSLGENDKLNEMNKKIQSLGGFPIAPSSIPTLIAFDATSGVNQQKPAAQGAPIVLKPGESPLFSHYAKSFVEYNTLKWQVKDAYETMDEYQARVSEATREQKIKTLLKQAEQDYVQMYTSNIKLEGLKLKPYDADNEVFLAESEYGEIIIPVPRGNKEAQVFERNWRSVKYSEPTYYIKNDELMLSGLTFTTPTGRAYRYDNKEALAYTETVIDINFDPIDKNFYATSDKSVGAANVSRTIISMGGSDVDINIPQTDIVNNKTFAVIIANENYEAVPKVPMALNDGTSFSAYCEQTLGLPKSNIRSYYDATYGTMLRAMRDISTISEVFAGDIRVIFYYAGHGIPDENSKSAYLLPVDSDGKHTESCYSLDRLYAELGNMKAQHVSVFLDACFSGAKRDGGTISETSRGVAIKSKPSAPKGNMVIFSAASDDETALPYNEKGHGLFTYYLLKKLQETQGNTTLGELGDYIEKQVKGQSVVINRKLQSPSVVPSTSIFSSWSAMKLMP